MSQIPQDPMFFYAVSFFIFVALAVKFGRKPMAGWLDGEIAKIRVELDHARELRAEAEAALLDCQAKQRAAEAEAQAIIAHAQQNVAAMRAQAEADLAASMKRQEALAAERIRIAETDAIAVVRAAAVDLAMGMARQTVGSALTEADATRLVDQAIGDIAALQARKAKAA